MQSGFESSARLSAVRWTVAGKLNEQLVGPARQIGEFFLPLDHKACGHRSISEFTNSERKVRVHVRHPKLGCRLRVRPPPLLR